MLQGRTIIDCPNENVKVPPTVYEKPFYGKGQASQPAISWLEKTSQRLGIHIHHAMCGHGGERWRLGAPVDGYDPKSKTIFQYHGCWWHGFRRCFPDRDKRIAHGNTGEELYMATLERTRALINAGYSVIEKWECDDIKTKEKETPKTDKNVSARDFLRL